MNKAKLIAWILGALIAVGGVVTGTTSVGDAVAIAFNTDKAKAACVGLLTKTEVVAADEAKDKAADAAAAKADAESKAVDSDIDTK